MSTILSKPKHNDFQAISKWILPCIEGFSAVFGKYENNAVTIMPDTSEVLQKYLDKTSRFRRGYAIQVYFSVAENTTIFNEEMAEADFNIKVFEIANSINEWIMEQNTVQNFPEVDGWRTLLVETTSIMPNFDGVDDMNLARFTIFCRVTYHGKI